MEALIAFVAKYWLNFLLVAAGSGVTALAQKLYKRYKTGKKMEENKPFEQYKSEIGEILKDNLEAVTKRQQDFEERIENGVFGVVKEKEAEFKKEETELLSKMDALTIKVQESINAANVRRKGLLEIYRKSFLESCKILLQSGHIITDEEFEDLTSAYKIYKELGGNHQGDTNYRAVEDKYYLNK